MGHWRPSRPTTPQAFPMPMCLRGELLLDGGSTSPYEELTPLYKRLPHGPHGLGREAVARHQRARLYGGMVESVYQRGYAGTSVAHVIALAGVSRTGLLRAVLQQGRLLPLHLRRTRRRLAQTGAAGVAGGARLGQQTVCGLPKYSSRGSRTTRGVRTSCSSSRSGIGARGHGRLQLDGDCLRACRGDRLQLDARRYRATAAGASRDRRRGALRRDETRARTPSRRSSRDSPTNCSTGSTPTAPRRSRGCVRSGLAGPRTWWPNGLAS